MAKFPYTEEACKAQAGHKHEQSDHTDIVFRVGSDFAPEPIKPFLL